MGEIHTVEDEACKMNPEVLEYWRSLGKTGPQGPPGPQGEPGLRRQVFLNVGRCGRSSSVLGEIAEGSLKVLETWREPDLFRLTETLVEWVKKQQFPEAIDLVIEGAGLGCALRETAPRALRREGLTYTRCLRWENLAKHRRDRRAEKVFSVLDLIAESMGNERSF